jgi:hypothetical protein
MGYFDGLTSSAFQKSPEGQTLFYPNGKLGKGYVVNEAQVAELKTFIKRYYMIILPLVIIGVMTIKLYTIIFILLSFPLYYIPIYKILGKSAVKTDQKYSIKDNMQNVGKSMGKGTAIALLITDIILLLISIPLAFDEKSRIIGIFSIAFWTLGLFVFINYVRAASKSK